MGLVIIKPTFANPNSPTPEEQALLAEYEQQLQVIRILISPDQHTFTTDDISDAELDSGAYIGPAERKVSQDTGIAIPLAAGTSDQQKADFIYAVQVSVALRYLPRAQQLIRQSKLDSSVAYSETDYEDRKESLTIFYKEAIDEFMPVFDAGSGGVSITNSRLDY